MLGFCSSAGCVCSGDALRVDILTPPRAEEARPPTLAIRGLFVLLITGVESAVISISVSAVSGAVGAGKSLSTVFSASEGVGKS